MSENFCPSYPLPARRTDFYTTLTLFSAMSILHEDVTSTTFTLLATTLSSAWKRTRTTLTFRATTLNPGDATSTTLPLLTTTLLWLQICL